MILLSPSLLHSASAVSPGNVLDQYLVLCEQCNGHEAVHLFNPSK